MPRGITKKMDIYTIEALKITIFNGVLLMWIVILGKDVIVDWLDTPEPKNKTPDPWY